MCSLNEAYDVFTDPPVVAKQKQKKRKRYLLPPPENFQSSDEAPGSSEEPAESMSVGSILNAGVSDSYFPHPTSDVLSNDVYNLDPKWAKMFTDTTAPAWIKDRMPDRQAEPPLIPSAWVDGQSTLWKNVNPGSVLDVKGAQTLADSRVEALQKKLDAMFARLDDMDAQKRNGTNLELVMFVFGGFFLLIVLDLLVKQGTTATIALNNASTILHNASAAARKGLRS